MSSILIVENKKELASVLKLFCQKLNYTVFNTVNNYDDAMKEIHQNNPDLIITDITLKGEKSGLDIARSAEKLYGIPSIFLTDYYNDEILKKAKNISFHGYIITPYKEIELEATIKLVLNQIERNKFDKKRYVKISNYMFDTNELILYNEKEEVTLSKKAKRLVYYLSIYLGKTKSYADIIDYVYEGDNVDLDTLRHLIHRVRVIIPKKCIQSSKNIGYSLCQN